MIQDESRTRTWRLLGESRESTQGGKNGLSNLDLHAATDGARDASNTDHAATRIPILITLPDRRGGHLDGI